MTEQSNDQHNEQTPKVDVALALYFYECGKTTSHARTNDFFSGEKTVRDFNECLRRWQEDRAQQAE